MPSKRRAIVEAYRSYDVIMGRYFIGTFLIGVIYCVGAGLGFTKARSAVCLIVSGILGLIFIVVSIAHAIDFYTPGVAIETLYVAIPFSKFLSSEAAGPDLIYHLSSYLFTSGYTFLGILWSQRSHVSHGFRRYLGEFIYFIGY